MATLKMVYLINFSEYYAVDIGPLAFGARGRNKWMTKLDPICNSMGIRDPLNRQVS